MYLARENPIDHTWDYWMKEWWVWLMSLPAGFNPCNDHSGEFTSAHQPHLQERVYFLAGTHSAKAERTCKIPSGTSILLGAVTMSASKAEFGDHLREDELLQIAKDGNQIESLVVQLDDDPIIDHKYLEQNGYHKQTSLFSVNLPLNNIMFCAPEGETQAIADGYWVFLKPLPERDHKLYIKQSTKDHYPSGTINCKNEVTHYLKSVK